MSTQSDGPEFVSRAGRKLAWALEVFKVDPSDKVCADLGANVGGFTDCLLQRGVRKIYAIDTGYGVLDYKLRKDPRVVVYERTNALYFRLPELVDLVVIDLGWTPQKYILPRAREMIKPDGQIVSLVKPHYEAPKEMLKGGVLEPADAEKIFNQVVEDIPQWGLSVKASTPSAIRGSGGNVEYLVLLEKTLRIGNDDHY